jgi:hypothetical protein
MKNIDTYNQEIKAYFLRVKNTMLPNPTTSSIKSRCISLLNQDLENYDKTIVKNFLKITSEENLIKEITKKDSDTFKSILNYLNNKTKKFKTEETYSFVAWIIEFNPRPYADYIKDNNIQEKEDVPSILIKPKEDILNQEVQKDKKLSHKNISADIEQVNIFSAFNFSKIRGRIKGSLSQLNFWSFGNKQEVNENDE